MATPQITEKQHFIPKFYLKRFADNRGFLETIDVKKRQLGSKRPYPSVCYSSYFYAANTGVPDDLSQVIENWLQQIESAIVVPMKTLSFLQPIIRLMGSVLPGSKSQV